MILMGVINIQREEHFTDDGQRTIIRDCLVFCGFFFSRKKCKFFTAALLGMILT